MGFSLAFVLLALAGVNRGQPSRVLPLPTSMALPESTQLPKSVSLPEPEVALDPETVNEPEQAPEHVAAQSEIPIVCPSGFFKCYHEPVQPEWVDESNSALFDSNIYIVVKEIFKIERMEKVGFSKTLASISDNYGVNCTVGWIEYDYSQVPKFTPIGCEIIPFAETGSAPQA